MRNRWIEIRNDRLKRLEEARLALQRWCNKRAYDDWGFFTTQTTKFYQMYPQYIEFEAILKVNWNMINLNSPDGATGLPEVIIQEDN